MWKICYVVLCPKERSIDLARERCFGKLCLFRPFPLHVRKWSYRDIRWLLNCFRVSLSRNAQEQHALYICESFVRGLQIPHIKECIIQVRWKLPLVQGSLRELGQRSPRARSLFYRDLQICFRFAFPVLLSQVAKAKPERSESIKFDDNES